MLRNNQFGLSTALKVAVPLALFFAAVRYFGLGVAYYGLSISGAVFGILLGHRSQTSSIIGATMGGAIGAGLGGLALIVIDPLHHRHLLDPATGVAMNIIPTC